MRNMRSMPIGDVHARHLLVARQEGGTSAGQASQPPSRPESGHASTFFAGVLGIPKAQCQLPRGTKPEFESLQITSVTVAAIESALP